MKKGPYPTLALLLPAFVVALAVFIPPLIAEYGILEYKNPISGNTYLYVAVGGLMVVVGLLIGLGQTTKQDIGVKFDPLKWQLAALMVSCLANPAVLLANTNGINPFDVFLNPGEFYLKIRSGERDFSAYNADNVALLAYQFLTPLTSLLIPLTLLYGKQLPKSRLWLSWIIILIGYLGAASLGTVKAITDSLSLLPWFMSMRFYRRGAPSKAVLSFAGTIVLLVTLVVVIFSRSQAQRASGVFLIISDVGDYAVRLNHPIVQSVPEEAVGPAVLLSSYITQGIYGVDQALKVPDDPQWFGASLYGYRKWSGTLFGDDKMFDRSIPMQIERTTSGDWTALEAWNSAYAWWASDFGFAGALVCAGILGWLIGVSWKYSLTTEDPFAPALFGTTITGAIFIYANNQIFHTPSLAIQTTGLLLLFFGSRLTRTKPSSLPADPVSISPASTSPGSTSPGSSSPGLSSSVDPV